jgi:hypothetical protein
MIGLPGGLLDDLREWKLRKRCPADVPVELIDVSLVVPAMVKRDRLCGNVGLQGVLRVGKVGEGKGAFRPLFS